MPPICHTICLLDEKSLHLLYIKKFEQCIVKKLPIESHVVSKDDMLIDFKRQYNKYRKNSTAYSNVQKKNEKTGFLKNTNIPPILSNTSYPFIKYFQTSENGIIFLSIYSTSFVNKNEFYTDVDCFQVFQYLNELSQLLSSFFDDSLTPNLISMNPLIINEIVEETMDFGIPQLSDYNLLHEYIKFKSKNKENELEMNGKSTISSNNLLQGFTESKKTEKSNLHFFNFLTSMMDKTSSKENKDVKTASEDIYMKATVITTLSDVINWRPKGIYYKKNEIFIDVVEKIKYIQDFSMLDKGNVKSFELQGSILCKSYLSGMPLIKMGLINDAAFNIDRRIQLDQGFQFHQCVQEIDDTYYKQNSENKLLKFIPPDGEFELCNYKFDLMDTNNSISHPPVIEIVSFTKKTKEGSAEKLKSPALRVNLQIKTYFKKNLVPEYLHIKIPITSFIKNINLLDLTAPPKFKTDFGKLVFNLSDDFIVWECANIKGNYGDRMYECFLQFQLVDEHINKLKHMKRLESMDAPPVREGPKLEKIYEELHDTKNNLVGSDFINLSQNKLQIEFEIPYFIASGLKIDFIKVEEEFIEKYQFFSWIRYKTQNEPHDYYVVIDATDSK
ncbi:hypothetical protein QEN19_002794 [Hanseniaspora menglaensis]